MDNFEDDLEQIFIEETFHRSEPIREKPIQTFIDRVVIKDRKQRIKDISGVYIKSEFKTIRKTVNERFAELQTQRQQLGVVFETDDEDIDDNDEDSDYEDINETDGLSEELALSSGPNQSQTNKRKLLINLAKKLKKKSIANRLGMAYMPGSAKMKDMRSRLGTTKSWSEKFGKLLAAKKLLYLPLLFRKYNMGPKKTREELDIEIDLYMSEVRNKKMKLAFDDITNASDSVDNNNQCFNVVKSKELFAGFGGPGWRKRSSKTKAEEEVIKPDKQSLDMEIDEYMANKTSVQTDSPSDNVHKEELDMDLDAYMAAVKNKNFKTEVLVNSY